VSRKNTKWLSTDEMADILEQDDSISNLYDWATFLENDGQISPLSLLGE
jgi:hypothetical protein